MKEGGIKKPPNGIMSDNLCDSISSGWGRQVAMSGIKMWDRRIGNNRSPVVRVHLLQEDI